MMIFMNKVRFSFGLTAVFMILAVAMIFAAQVPAVEAATLFLSPEVGQYQIGQTFDVEVRIDSQGQAFNAAQATVQFPANALQVKSLDFSSPSSIFNFWLEQPTFSNSGGTVSFIGGSTSGLVGSSVGVLKITFTANASGNAPVTISDAAVTASDGSGSNILSSISSAQYNVVPSLNAPKLPVTATTTKPLMPAPAPITRKPTVTKKLPIAPVVSVPLYPDQKSWYNEVTDFLTQWDLPDDVSGISSAVNQNLKFALPTKSEGLFDAKTFPSLSDGIWYWHIMFQNNVGWGPITTYRIAIDTVPPLPFTISTLESTATDSPIRTLEFGTSDGLSGLDHYLVRVDNSDEVKVASGTLTLAPETPGQHNVTVKAVDAAGNIRENSFQFNINPLQSPVITSISKNVYAQISDLILEGNSVPNASLALSLKDINNVVISQTAANADQDGTWVAKFDGPFRIGQYYVELTAKDYRGALSLPVKSEIFSVREKPVFVIWSWEITQLWLWIGISIIVILMFLCGWYSRRLWRKQAARKVIIAQRDVNNILDSTDKNLDTMLHHYDDGKIDENEAAETEFLLKQTKDKLKKAKKYVTDNIKEINE